MSRRSFLRLGAATGTGLYAALAGGPFGATRALAAPGRGAPGLPAPSPPAAALLRRPGSRTRPDLPAGTDIFPGIDHIVVLMMENHSYDNYLGVLGRGDGLTVGADGSPRNQNLDAGGRATRSFPLPTTCQTLHLSLQSWNASHAEFDGGRNDGFARVAGPAAMGYYTPADLPFYSGLARTFPLADRWFASCLGPTHPNRRFLIAATAAGLVHNRSAISYDAPPASGTIFNLLDAHGLSWRNYYVTAPTAGLYMAAVANRPANLVPVSRFFADAKSGTLPNFSIVDPDFGRSSEESPMDVSVGEAFSAGVINAVMRSPAWPKTVLIWCYDEHGGYYDHVSPPQAVKPDAVEPQLGAGDTRAGFDRYGFRVPAVVVSPYARPGYISHVVHDHTSVLKLVETKWNLPALTYRDANASDLFDCLDLRRAAFLRPPALPAPANPAGVSRCARAARGPLRAARPTQTVDASGAPTTLATPTRAVAADVDADQADAGAAEFVTAAAIIGAAEARRGTLPGMVATGATVALGRNRLLRWASGRPGQRRGAGPRGMGR